MLQGHRVHREFSHVTPTRREWQRPWLASWPVVVLSLMVAILNVPLTDSHGIVRPSARPATPTQNALTAHETLATTSGTTGAKLTGIPDGLVPFQHHDLI